jgi:hypothetical protein
MIRVQIKSCQSAGGGSTRDPEHTEIILVELADLWSEWDMPRNLPCLTIEDLQTAAVRYPEPPRPVLPCEFNIVPSYARLLHWVMDISRKLARRRI